MTFIRIEILDAVKPEDFSYHPSTHYYSGHMYRHSPYETDTDCGNCDGARCDTCERIIVPEHWEFDTSIDRIREILVECKVSNELIENIINTERLKYTKNNTTYIVNASIDTRYYDKGENPNMDRVMDVLSNATEKRVFQNYTK